MAPTGKQDMSAAGNSNNTETDQIVGLAVLSEDPTCRAQLCSILEQATAIEVLAEAANIENLVEFLDGVDVLVLASAMVSDALSLLADRDSPQPAVLLISDDLRQSESLTRLAATRAWGLLDPGSNPEELTSAVLSLNQGLVVAAPHLLRPLLNRGSERRESLPQERLSARELEILRLLAQGMANKEIAWELKISSNTVKFHTSSIYGKLGVASRAEAVFRGIELGLIIV